ncbi:MAG TPA: signal recognition particle-docking protein FtsY [Bryobacteraceae bacterium]|nr:signal recognition particle-docking protein FtsY [Bryobacteraceae bacterium]
MEIIRLFDDERDAALAEEAERARAAEEAGEDAKSRFFGRMRQAVTRTRESFSTRIEGIAAITRTVDERDLEELETALITSDIGVQTTTTILDALRDRARRKAIEGGEELRSLLKEQLQAILEAPGHAVAAPAAPPKVTFLVGVNGTGKTTTSGKLAAWNRGQNRTVLLCAADTFRAAAIEQLEVWASRSGVEMIKSRPGGDPSAVLYDSISAARARNVDDVIVDTAGRLHTKTGLMDELDKLRRTAGRLVPGAPHEVLLSMDATTGQNGLQQARLFTQSAGVTGIVLTKLDGTAKGGIAVAIARELNLPVRYVGVGEQMGDLLEFSPKVFVDSLVG